jgi:hypothetical protein
VPPPYLSWNYRPGEQGEKRNLGGYRVSDWLMSGVGDVIERHSRRFGLTPRRRAEDCFSPIARNSRRRSADRLSALELPESFHYLGPVQAGPRGGVEAASRATNGRSPSARSARSQGSRASIFRKVAEASDRLGLRLVLAHGGRLPPEDIARLPGEPLSTISCPSAQCSPGPRSR